MTESRISAARADRTEISTDSAETPTRKGTDDRSRILRRLYLMDLRPPRAPTRPRSRGH